MRECLPVEIPGSPLSLFLVEVGIGLQRVLSMLEADTTKLLKARPASRDCQNPSVSVGKGMIGLDRALGCVWVK